MKQYFIYILTNKSNKVLYVGVTNNLARRLEEHIRGKGSKFTKKYNLNKLVHFEIFDDINAAIAREKQIKAGSRSKKLELIELVNANWRDLKDQIPLT